MECIIIFKRSHDGEIEMYRQVERSITQEGRYWDESMRVFSKRLTKTLQQLSVGSRLVMKVELQGSVTGTRGEDPRGK